MVDIEDLEDELNSAREERKKKKKKDDGTLFDKKEPKKENKESDENSGWKKVGSYDGDGGFDAIINSRDWEELEELVAVYKDKIENFTKYNDPAFVFVTSDGKEIAVVAPTILKSRLEKVEQGQKTRIVYKGMTETESGRKAYNFDVYVKD